MITYYKKILRKKRECTKGLRTFMVPHNFGYSYAANFLFALFVLHQDKVGATAFRCLPKLCGNSLDCPGVFSPLSKSYQL